MQSALVTQTNPDSQSAEAPLSLIPPNHSGRLRYAEAKDLPSFPSLGLKKDSAAASAAASLGWANVKAAEIWKPDKSASASAAAVLAKDYKMAPAWEPEPSAAGSRAALLAVGSANSAYKARASPPTPSNTWVTSAATLAFRASKLPSQTKDGPNTSSPSGLDGVNRAGSMRAARGAMAASRPRSRSLSSQVPNLYPDQANAAANALSAATIAHRPSIRSNAGAMGDSGATPVTNMGRQMYTSKPVMKAQVDDQKRADVLHASAVAMAKRMFTQQQKIIDTAEASTRQRSSSMTRHRRSSIDSDDDGPPPMVLGSLQQEAYRLAQERLAKLQAEHDKTRGLQEYYGTPTSTGRSRLGSIRGKLTRRRSSSDSSLIEDRKRSQQIRQQMFLFNNKLSEVDVSKRTKDRQALMAAAQRNVKATMEGLDQKMYAETGRIGPTILKNWEAKAEAAARARVDTMQDEGKDKIDMGGGMFMDQSTVDEIAAKRVQPLLDEINENAERERERKAAAVAEQEKKKVDEEKARMREKEIQDIHKKLKEQEKEDQKVMVAELKRAERARKEEEKMAKAGKGETATPTPGSLERETGSEKESPQTQSRRQRALSIVFPFPSKNKDKDARSTSPPGRERSVSGAEPSSTSSPTSKVRSWFKTKLSRPRARTSAAGDDKGFAGGAGLVQSHSRSQRSHHTNDSTSSINDRDASMREVALVGRSAESASASAGEGSDPKAQKASRSIRSVSSLSQSNEDNFVEASSEISKRPVTPPRVFKRTSPTGRGSPARGSRFSEVLE